MNQVMRSVFLALRLLTPWIIYAVAISGVAISVAIRGIVDGIRPTAHDVADDVVYVAVNRGLPNIYASRLHALVFIVAVLCILAVWLLLAHVTVFFIHMLVF